MCVVRRIGGILRPMEKTAGEFKKRQRGWGWGGGEPGVGWGVGLIDPIVSSPPGSPVPGILQARTLEWVAISFSNA